MLRVFTVTTKGGVAIVKAEDDAQALRFAQQDGRCSRFVFDDPSPRVSEVSTDGEVGGVYQWFETK